MPAVSAWVRAAAAGLKLRSSPSTCAQIRCPSSLKQPATSRASPPPTPPGRASREQAGHRGQVILLEGERIAAEAAGIVGRDHVRRRGGGCWCRRGGRGWRRSGSRSGGRGRRRCRGRCRCRCRSWRGGRSRRGCRRRRGGRRRRRRGGRGRCRSGCGRRGRCRCRCRSGCRRRSGCRGRRRRRRWRDRGKDEVRARRGVAHARREAGGRRGRRRGRERAGDSRSREEGSGRGGVGSGREGKGHLAVQGRGSGRDDQVDGRGRDSDDQVTGRGLGVRPVDGEGVAAQRTIGEVQRPGVGDGGLAGGGRDRRIDAIADEQRRGRVDREGAGREVVGQREARSGRRG